MDRLLTASQIINIVPEVGIQDEIKKAIQKIGWLIR